MTSTSPLLADKHNNPMANANNPTDDDPEAQINAQPDSSADAAPAGAAAETPQNTADEEGHALRSWLITLIMTGICFGISYATTTYYECLVSFGVNWLSFLAIAWPLHTEKYYDFTGMISFLCCDIFSMLYRQVPWEIAYVRNVVMFFMIMCWTLRLGLFLFQRISRKHGGKDARFDPLRNNFARFAVAWTLQAAWAYFCCMPIFILNSIDNGDVVRAADGDVTPLDIVGWALWCFGWGIEILADRQKSAFKADPSNRGKFCNVGLWSLSRHPNYFGEITLWIGLFVSSASVAKNAGWLSVLSPVWTIILLVFSSGIPLAERTAMKKYGDTPGYKEYVRDVSVLIPLPCCWKCYT